MRAMPDWHERATLAGQMVPLMRTSLNRVIPAKAGTSVFKDNRRMTLFSASRSETQNLR